eukprot:2979706-Prorocentrum_lima.AAC.1
MPSGRSPSPKNGTNHGPRVSSASRHRHRSTRSRPAIGSTLNVSAGTRQKWMVTRCFGQALFAQ